MACPVSSITRQTWDVLALVNDCLSTEGDLLQLPFSGALLDQPDWFREAVKIVRSERAEHLKRKTEASRHGR